MTSIAVESARTKVVAFGKQVIDEVCVFTRAQQALKTLQGGA